MAKRVLSGAGLGLALMAGCLASSAVAQQGLPTSDRAAGYLVFPKIVVDVSGVLHDGRRVDTFIQLTNTDATAVHVAHCTYINATSTCTGTSLACQTSSDCRGVNSTATCDPQWSVGADFELVLNLDNGNGNTTRHLKPDGWSANDGSDPDSGLGAPFVPLTTDGVFIGEMVCVEVDGNCASTNCQVTGLQATTDSPINANDLKGEATIFELTSGATGSVDAREYNAIGFQSVLTDDAARSSNVLCLGSTPNSTECTTAQYAGCPAQLALNHWFDGAQDTFTDSLVTTEITLVPCSVNTVDLRAPMPTTTVQLLVMNEFEQRFSALTKLTCFKETPLSDLDVAVGQEKFSIFNINLEGTLAGQTRFRPVQTSETENGHGVVAVAEEFFQVEGVDAPMSTAFNVNYIGQRTQGDFVRILP